MSFIDRFKKRKTISPVVEVVLEIDGPNRKQKIVLKIARFASEELSGVLLETEAFLIKNKIDRAEAPAVFNTEFSRALFQRIKRHVKGWEIEGEEIPFNKENVELLFGEMFLDEQLALVGAYQAALEADEKKTAAPVVSATPETSETA